MSKKIALYKPRYVSLTQVFPVLITDSLGSPALTEDGNLLGLNSQYPLCFFMEFLLVLPQPP